MRTTEITRRYGVSYRQVDHWLHRMGYTPGTGYRRDVSNEMLFDLLRILDIHEKARNEVNAILAKYESRAPKDVRR